MTRELCGVCSVHEDVELGKGASNCVACNQLRSTAKLLYKKETSFYNRAWRHL